VQRQRGDVSSYPDEQTPFPRRVTAEETYRLSPEYQRLFGKVLSYARQLIAKIEQAAADQQLRPAVRDLLVRPPWHTSEHHLPR
jgi:hypothetical protein